MTAQWHLPSQHRFGRRLCWLLALLSVLVQWCAPCEDLPSQDGSAWKAVNGYSCDGDYGGDPVPYCTDYGSGADQYGLTGTEACCLCGGGLRTAAPTQVLTQVGDTFAPTEAPTTRQALIQFYEKCGLFL